jgi:hypothetical protein
MALKGGGGGSSGGIRAGAAFVELFTKDTALERGLKSASAKLRKWGAGLRNIGLGAIGLSAPVLGGLAAATNTLGDLAQIKNVGDAFGLSAEQATGFFGVMKAAGSDTRDATEGLVTLGQRVTDALSGTGIEAKQLFDGLGVSASEFAGLDPAEQFFKLHESLLAVQDPAKRVQLLLKAVGEDTGKNMINTLSMTTAQLREQAKGFSLNEQELKSAKEATIAYNRATASLGKVWQQVAVSVAPVITQLADYLLPVLQIVAEMVRQNRALVTGIAVGGLAVAGLGAGLVAMGVGIQLAGAALGGLVAAAAAAKAVLLAIFSPAGLGVIAVTAAIAGLGYLFVTQTEAGRHMKDGIVGYFGEIKDTAVTSWGAIQNAVSAGRIDLAFKVIAAAMELEWQRLTYKMTDLWNGFKGETVDAWHDAVYVTSDLLVDWGAGVQKVFVDVAAAIRRIFGDAFDDIYKAAKDNPLLTTLLGGAPLLVLGDINDKLKGGATPEELKRQIDQDAQATQRELSNQAQRDQAARNAARAADLQAAAGRLAAAQGAFGIAVNEANAAKSEPPPPKKPPSAVQMQLGSSAGTFSGNLRQLLGGQQVDQLKVSRQHLTEAEKANNILKDINDGVKKMNGTFA